VGVGFGGAGFVGAVATVHPLTLITGTLPDDENATLHPAGATTSNGIVTLTVPLVVAVDAVVVDVGDWVCAVSCAPRRIRKTTNRNTGTECRFFVPIVDPF
jgi:hypothetical protein